MRTLIINTYGGSLLVAARRRGDEIVGSYEDAGYGVDWQRENFPEVDVRPRSVDWPHQRLDEIVTIAHPPCAAFSTQNRGNAAHRGADAPKFKCTLAVMDYAMRSRTPALAIESVPGALEGGRDVHESFALEHGYELYRVLLNAAVVGVPQYRPRFWAIFVRKGLLPNRTMKLAVTPTRRTMGEVVDEAFVGTPIPWIEKTTAQQLERLRLALEPQDLTRFLRELDGSVVRRIPEFLGSKNDEADPYRKSFSMGWNYASHSMVGLQPSSLAPTLMAGSWWWYRSRALYAEEYKAVMDFPRDYRIPLKHGGSYYYTQRLREYLSRGVCPATAVWVLDQIEANLAGKDPVGTEKIELPHSEVARFLTQRRLNESTGVRDTVPASN